MRNSNTYGFTLSMNAGQPNLVNDKDSTYKIDSVSGTNQQLAANQWGYGMGKDATTFNSVTSATLADVTSDSKGNCTSVDDCTLHLTFGANLDSRRLPTGSYSTSLTYTATSKPAPYVPPAPAPEPPEPKWTTNGCYYSNGDWHNCFVDEPTNTEKVVWRGDAWYVVRPTYKNEDWFSYDKYNTTWAHAAILTESGKQKESLLYRGIGSYNAITEVKLDINDIAKILAYVPAYSIQGSHINFCRSIDTTLHTCEYSDVGENFNSYYKDENGFWVGLRAMGCTNVPDESKCNDGNHEFDCRYYDAIDKLNGYNRYDWEHISADAKKVADTLAEALGSPCY